MSEMRCWEYSVETVGGVFKLRSAKYQAVQVLCARRGRDGWELVDVSYDWFTVTYVLFFKRQIIEK